MHEDLSPSARTLVLSYRGVRRAVGTVGLAMPVLLGGGGLLLGVPLQENLSGYYHTELRDVFVGLLCALATFLFCYRGHGRFESWTANAGALFAVACALFPLDAGRDPLAPRTLSGWIHTLSGGALFATLAVYSLYHFPRSQSDRHDRERRWIYLSSGVVLLASVGAMAAHLFFAPPDLRSTLNEHHFLFWAEGVALWAFAAAWLTKGRVILAELAVDLLARPRELLGRRRR